jgi:hypothetical protein
VTASRATALRRIDCASEVAQGDQLQAVALDEASLRRLGGDRLRGRS